MKTLKLLLFIGLSSGLIFTGCAKKKASPPPPPKLESFITLDDVNGQTTLTEKSPSHKVVLSKAKAIIKENDIRGARKTARNNAAKKALDYLVAELLTSELYNANYEAVEKYMSNNINKYIIDEEIYAARKIFMGRFYGVAVAFRLDRQKVLTALQKDLKIIDNNLNTIITVITSKKVKDLKALGYSMSDVESTLLNQAQTDLNQKGLRAMDFRNALNSLNMNASRKAKYKKLTAAQFVDMVDQGNGQDPFYSGGLTLLKQMAKVVLEVNILSISESKGSISLNVNVTAKNISSPTGGAFANSMISVSIQKGRYSNKAAIMSGLIKDTYAEMNREFLPQVTKEMSTIDAGGDKLMTYEIVFQGYDSKVARSIRNSLKRHNEMTYIDFDNSLARVQPSINRVFVRYAGKPSNLADVIMSSLDRLNVGFIEPPVTPTSKDIVFVAQ